MTGGIRIDLRVCLFALLAIALGGWAWMTLAALDTGTLRRPGPGMVPRAVAAALVVVGALSLIRAATGFANAPPRPLWLPLRLILLLALLALVMLEEIVAYLGDEPAVAALAEELKARARLAGPMELLALSWLRWTLLIAIGVVASGEGALTGLGSLLVGLLIGLADTDIMSATERLPQVSRLLDQIPAWTGYQGSRLPLLIAVVLVLILCRVNFLPAALACLGAPAAEDDFRRAMGLSLGDPLSLIQARPVAQGYLAASAAITLAILWYRWPWRRTRRS